ncbi:MAG: DUF192 domain-containing protein [Pseudobdellovibrionaceae bacterium]
MAKLFNSDMKLLLPDLRKADRMFSRVKGLLGTSHLPAESGLWIHPCNSIHTFFMKYAIDCVFVDSDLQVKALVKDIQPGRMVWPVWGARSVIELSSGSIEKLGLKVGDQLHVGA